MNLESYCKDANLMFFKLQEHCSNKVNIKQCGTQQKEYEKYFPSTTLPTNDKYFFWFHLSILCGVHGSTRLTRIPYNIMWNCIGQLLFQVRSSCASNLTFEFAHNISFTTTTTAHTNDTANPNDNTPPNHPTRNDCHCT